MKSPMIGVGSIIWHPQLCRVSPPAPLQSHASYDTIIPYEDAFDSEG